MLGSYRIMAAASLIFLLGACAPGTRGTADIGSVENMELTGTAFDKALHDEYVRRAKVEAREGDYTNANRFLDKARPAAGGTLVLPAEPGNWSVPAGATDELGPARARLVSALDQNARTSMPEAAARTQRLYDCWVEEWSENIQPDDIAACRSGFFQALAELEGGAPPAVARPAGRQEVERFIVLFDFNSSAINAKGRKVIAEAVASAKGAMSYSMTLRGHTDRAGSNEYNEALAQSRTASVAGALRRSGVATGPAQRSSFGERRPTVATKDGVAKAANRRVEIFVDKIVPR